jgi:GNAT superfamily N-acetyltransferase
VAAIYVASSNDRFSGFFPRRELTSELVARWAVELMAAPPFHWWVAEDSESEIAGFAGIGVSRDPVDPSLGELDTIAVRPTQWRCGIGRSLMSVAVGQLGADGYDAAVLWTINGLVATEAFYRSMGWRAEGVTRDHGRQVRYRLNLSASADLAGKQPIR